MKGVQAALVSALFLGLSPVFGKQAMLAGLPWQSVVAIRTSGAAVLILLVVVIYRREFLYIYPAGFLGCLLAGGINGLGSLFYYSALSRLDASLGQLLYALYPFFVAAWLWMEHQPPSRLTLLRLGLTLPGIYLLVSANHKSVDLIGVSMMLAAAMLYALHLLINQRVLYDMPAPTVTLYTLLSMSAVVVPVFLLSGVFKPGSPPVASLVHISSIAAWSMTGMTLVTFISRLSLFTGVKHLGGMQAAILGLGELLVVIVFAHLWLGENLAPQQWIGAVFLVVSLSLMVIEKPVPGGYKRSTGGWLGWLKPPGVPGDFPWTPGE
jgi:drug/metabolite transporter (DMT)-like permease